MFGRAAAAWQALPRPYDALLARERQAHCLLAAGRSSAGLSLLAGVQEGLSQLGATGDADRVARALRERGVTVPRVWRGGQRGYGGELSPRELEVVRLVVAGRSTREIAEELYRSQYTVYTQASRRCASSACLPGQLWRSVPLRLVSLKISLPMVRAGRRTRLYSGNIHNFCHRALRQLDCMLAARSAVNPWELSDALSSIGLATFLCQR